MKKYFKLIILSSFVLLMLSICQAFASEPEISYPQDGSKIYIADEIRVTAPDGAELSFVLDGKPLAKTCEHTQALPEYLSYGKHRIEVSYIEGKSVYTASSEFQYLKSYQAQSKSWDFTTLTSGESGFGAYGIQRGNGKDDTYQVVEGPGGTGDKALALISTGTETSNPWVRFTPQKAFGSGVFTLEFDLKLNDRYDSVSVEDYVLWYPYGNASANPANTWDHYIVKGGYYYGTDIPAPTDWVHITMVIDYENGTFLLKEDDKIIIDSDEIDNGDYGMSSSILGFTLTRTRSENHTNTPGFAIDNLSYSQELRYGDSDKLSYVKDGAQSDSVGEVIPCDSEAVIFHLNQAFKTESINNGNVFLRDSYGNKLSGTASADSSGKIISFVPDKALSGSESYEFVLGPKLQLSDGVALGREWIQRFETTAAILDTTADISIDSKKVIAAEQLRGGGDISVSVTATAVKSEIDATYVLALRCDNKLIAMTASEITAVAGTGTDFVMKLESVPALPPEGEIELILMNCKNFADDTAIDSFLVLH